MSAWVHDTEHIRAMVQAGLDYGRRSPLRWGTRALSDAEAREAYAKGQPWGPGARALFTQTVRELNRETADYVGVMLLAENQRSVNFRYDDDDVEPIYTHRAPQWTDGGLRSFSAVEILKAVESYEYQSCEHPEWRESEAARFCEALRRAAVNALPGYADADTWAITPKSRRQAAADRERRAGWTR